MDQSLAGRPLTLSRNNPRLILGLILIASWWILAWGDFGAISHYYFFPLWLGFILTVDGLVQNRTGTSPLNRLGWRYLFVFVVSAPFWWLFELLNHTLTNWSYLTPWDYGFIGRTIIGSFSFSIVIPAVLTTAELISSYLGNQRSTFRHSFSRTSVIAIHVLGWVMLLAMLRWPEYLFAFCWLSVFFIVDPLARAAGATTVSTLVERGSLRPVYSLALAGLVCGWFWEMWNFLAMPKWVYSVPHVGFLKIWEMPVLGYGGYIPFSFEISAFYVLVAALIPWMRPPPVSGSGCSSQIDPDDGRFL
ncbi:hypothetical protein BH23CHL2_BH23CHL2_04140 [soil metagenome]